MNDETGGMATGLLTILIKPQDEAGGYQTGH